MSEPRFARKEVRQFAKWLTRQGWEYDSEDAHGHPYYVWPGTGHRLSLPTTPHGHRWKPTLRAEACKAMGIDSGRPNHRTSRKPVEMPGFDMDAARRDRARRGDLSTADELLDAWDAEVERLRSLAAHRSYCNATEAKASLDRIRAIEDDLATRGHHRQPFDLSDLQTGAHR